MKRLKYKNGITLIALIITIIVLLILAGVSISAVVGENGIIAKAKEAKEETKKATEMEKEFTDGRIQIGLVWYDSIDDYLDGIPSKDQNMDTSSLRWKQLVVYEKNLLGLKTDGNVYINSTQNNDVENDTEILFKELISNNGKVVNVLGTPFSSNYYIMENGKAYTLVDEHFSCVNDLYEELKNEKIVNITYQNFIITEKGMAYQIVEENNVIVLNEVLEVLNNKKILSAGTYNISDSETVIMVLLEDKKIYCINPEGELVCFNEAFEELKNKKVSKLINASDSVVAVITEDGKLFVLDADLVTCFNEQYEVLKDQKIVDLLGEMILLDTGEALYLGNNNTLVSLNEEKEALKDKKILGLDYNLMNIWFQDGVSFYDYNNDSMISFGMQEFLIGKNIVQMSSGSSNGSHMVLLDNIGKVWSWGYNSHGQLGDGTTTDSTFPICISELEGNPLKNKKIVYIATGKGCTMAIDSSGKVWAWGNNGYGQLGDGTIIDSVLPICISEVEGSPLKNVEIKQISCDNYTVAVDSNGKVWTWGRNWYGTLGNGTTTDSTFPICISNLEDNSLNNVKIVQVSANFYYTLAIDNNGKVWGWGYNICNIIGGENNTKIYIPICMSELAGNPLKNVQVIQIETEENHAMALDNKGKVWTWGWNLFGQLGYEAEIENDFPKCINELNSVIEGKQIISIGIGEASTLIIDSNDNYYMFGKYELPEM